MSRLSGIAQSIMGGEDPDDLIDKEIEEFNKQWNIVILIHVGNYLKLTLVITFCGFYLR